MSIDFNSRLQSLLLRAVERPAENRSAWLRGECQGDEHLLREVRDLLGHLDLTTGSEKLSWSLKSPSPPGPASGSRGQRRSPLTTSGARLPDFPGYELLEEVARGGMGVVYRARQKKLGRIVALKVLAAGRFADHELRRRFLSEAASVAELDHPHIVPVFEFGDHDWLPFFSMAFIDGPSLRDAISDGPMDPRRAATLVSKVAGAIQFAHDRGIVHRDLKPANILLDASGEPRVADFGLAKRTSGAGDLTMAGQVLGTASFMPPEQAAGRFQDVGPLSDVYSLGATLYTLLCGRPPFEAESDLEILGQVQELEPPPLRSRNPKISRDLETICHCALQKDPRRRYQSAAALQQDLQRFLNGFCVTAKPLGWLERSVRWSRIKDSISFRSVISILLLLNVAVLSYAQSRESQLLIESQEGMRRLYSLVAKNFFERGKEEYDDGRILSSTRSLAQSLAILPETDSLRPIVQQAWDRAVQQSQSSSSQESDSTSIAVSSDGSRLLTTTFGQSFQLWSTHTGQPLAPPVTSKNLQSARFSPDGKWIVTAGDELCVWDGETAKRRFVVRGGFTYDAQFSPDSEFLYAVSRRGVFAFRADTGELVWGNNEIRIAPSRNLVGPLSKVSFRHDGQRFVTTRGRTAAAPGIVEIWDASTGRQIGKSPSLDDAEYATYVPGDDQILVKSRQLIGRLNGTTGEPIPRPPESPLSPPSSPPPFLFDGPFSVTPAAERGPAAPDTAAEARLFQPAASIRQQTSK